jgi:general secretion pathway protein A
MYENFYNLKAMPFQITSDPRFLWLGEKHSEALATLKYGILENRGFLLLTGDVGTGKTALINRLVKMIDVAAIIAKVPDPGLSSLDFFNFLSVEFEMNKTFDSKGAFLIYLKKFLLKAYADHKRVLLIVDEAQRLNHELLEQIRLLSNIELQNRKLINIFFVGQTEFGGILLADRNRAVRQRITVSYHIEPLEKAETREYIKHRLKVAGVTRDIFSKDAVREIYSFSAGYPRLINIICDHALLTGYASGAKSIDRKIILECKRELQIPLDLGRDDDQNDQITGTKQQAKATASKGKRSATFKRTVVFAALLMLIVLGVYIFTGQKTDDATRWAMEDIAPQEYKGKLPDETGRDQIGRIQTGQPQKAEANTNVSADEPLVRKSIAGPEVESLSQPDKRGQIEIPSDGQLQSPPPDNPPQETVAKTSQTAPTLAERKFTIYFKRNSNELPDESFETLNRIADFMQYTPDATIDVRGYTDSSGPYSYNVSVSEFRANTIKLYLVGKGIDTSKIRTFGLGPKDPIATNETAAGRQKNRRVELEIKAD